MYLFEFKGDLPKKADKATLHWEKGIFEPLRDGKKIHLPNDPVCYFFPLQDGRQFLFGIGYGNRQWFGGTDEEPFLVEVTPIARDNYVKGGGSEDDFYKGLIPAIISKIETETGIPHRRQGDIFAARFCANEGSFIKNLERLTGLTDRERYMHIEVDKSSFRLLGTRHEGQGTIVRIGNERELFSGTVKAPDHTPLSLDDGLYVIGQTRHIVNPKNAD